MGLRAAAGCLGLPPSMAPRPLPPRVCLPRPQTAGGAAQVRIWRLVLQPRPYSCVLATACLQLCEITPAQLPIQAGVDIFRVFDSLNDIDQLRFGIGESLTKAAAARGLKGHSRKARAACRGWLLHTWA